jgi:hypothetical protein
MARQTTTDRYRFHAAALAQAAADAATALTPEDMAAAAKSAESAACQMRRAAKKLAEGSA